MCSLLSERKISGVDICIALLGSEVRGKSVAIALGKKRKKIFERKVKTCIVVYFFFFYFCVTCIHWYICIFVYRLECSSTVKNTNLGTRA